MLALWLLALQMLYDRDSFSLKKNKVNKQTKFCIKRVIDLKFKNEVTNRIEIRSYVLKLFVFNFLSVNNVIKRQPFTK